MLDAAASQFASRGFQATTIRDIVGAVGMLPGSLYCHFPSKEALLVAVYAEGVQRIDAALAAAIARHVDPWDRFEAACVAHLDSLLDHSAYAKVVVSVQPSDVPAASRELAALRDGYENRIRDLLRALPAAHDHADSVIRMLILGALNWTPVWFRAGRMTAEQIAKGYVAILRRSMTARVEDK
ncbi:MAG: TetR family transcriptional regulator [Burkholderiales bacterium]|nr:TetR family transcriptional regulator [Burkholderiales bacterium]